MRSAHRIEREITEEEYYDWLLTRGFEQKPGLFRSWPSLLTRGLLGLFVAWLVYVLVKAAVHFAEWSWIVR
jgi:hypothetical protein